MVASVEGDDGVPVPQETTAPSDAATAQTLTRCFLDGDVAPIDGAAKRD